MERPLIATMAAFFSASMALAQPVPSCHYIPSTSTTGDTVNYTTVGGSFQSFGCAPIDPTYWINTPQESITATFLQATDHPAIRVWGMNDDDIAAVYVNSAPYSLDSNTATLAPKVVCGLSPGPDGVLFSGGYLAGANSNAEGNYSYQDVTLNVDGVNSIMVVGLSGAGWGFAGVLVDCLTSIPDVGSVRQALFPNPTTGPVRSPDRSLTMADVMIMNDVGGMVMQMRSPTGELDISELPSGVYTVIIVRDQRRMIHRLIKI